MPCSSVYVVGMLVSPLVLLLCRKYYVNIVDLRHAHLYKSHVDVFQLPGHQSSGEIPHIKTTPPPDRIMQH